ncbi:MAG: hypothetical protein ACK553_11020 [Planctomycetota bacterium]
MRKWVIGIDEAGYGPKMGPLVIGASVWSVPSELQIDRMLVDLQPEFQSRPWKSGDSFLPMGDSKALYLDKTNLDSLSIAIRFLLSLQGASCDSASSLIRHISPIDAVRIERQPWYQPDLEHLPWSDIPLGVDVVDAARIKLSQLGVEFHGFGCRIIDEEEFNRAVAIAGNKANALGEWSVGLLRDCIDLQVRGKKRVEGTDAGLKRVEGYCDRQGGRKRYAPLLTQVFQEWSPWFEILEETANCSRYRCRFDDLELAVGFRVQGDAMLPAAAASMLAKWIRELMMHRLNGYWRSQLGDALRPTAGYPVDAERFRASIEDRASALKHSTHAWWRCC